ncbi:retrovirus-related pol polyprotein from transposon TNT 1-94 [Tanacetum coccineum]
MTGNRKLFSSYKAYNGGNVIFGSNLRGNIIGKGTISNDSLKIDNVEHVDNLRFNLLSIGQICDNKCRVTFFEHDSEITKDGKVIGRGIRKKSLYVMKLGNEPNDKICLATIDENFTLWHRRLGHANMHLIQSLASKELVRNLPKLKFDQHFCDACKIGKQAHACHKAKNIVSTTRCLELLHMDLFGPSVIRSYGGNRYTLVIVDDYSRYTWTRFLKDKTEAFDQFEIFSKKIQNQLGCTIVSIRTDHGREFDNEVQFREFCNANGYSQNSKAYIILNKHSRKVEESLNVTFDETPPPSKTSPLVDDDLDEEEAIKVTEKKNLESDIMDETLEIDEIVNIKESRNHPLENNKELSIPEQTATGKGTSNPLMAGSLPKTTKPTGKRSVLAEYFDRVQQLGERNVYIRDLIDFGVYIIQDFIDMKVKQLELLAAYSPTASDIESEPLEAPLETEEPQPLAPTSSPPSSQRPPLTQTSPTLTPLRASYYRSNARMAVYTQPMLSPGLSAKLTKAMTLSPSLFRKRYISSYKTPSSSSSPTSSPTLLSRKRYQGISKLIADTEIEGEESEDEGTDSESEEAASKDQH